MKESKNTQRNKERNKLSKANIYKYLMKNKKKIQLKRKRLKIYY